MSCQKREKNKKTPTELSKLKRKALSNQDISVIKVALHMKYIDVQLRMGSQKPIWYSSYIKMGNREKIL